MISIIGLGFVGLTTGLGFAKKGYLTFGFDINQERMNLLNKGIIPFHEPHLKEVLEETGEKTFFLNVEFEKAIQKSKYVFLCVGTPSDEKGSADLTYIFKAIDQILNVPFEDRKILIIKSTVPPSTLSEKIQPYVLQKAEEMGRQIGLASNPEFLREGYCWEDFIKPDRVVIGAEDIPTQVKMKELYAPFEAPMHIVSFNTAEFIKYLSNTLLSTLISYSNEMSMIADKIGNINVADSFKILHGDKRWTGSPAGMSAYVYPGCGYGGYCLPKDTSALYNIAKEKGVDAKILHANLMVNAEVKDFIVNKVSKQVQKNESIGILGLSFKPESDDVRLSPTQEVIKKLQDFGYADIIAYDPLANQMFKDEYPEMIIDYAPSLENLLGKTKNVIVLTAWKEFKEKQELVQTKNVFDFRYMFI
jgi:UDPglucose 6-dehydrogenase